MELGKFLMLDTVARGAVRQVTKPVGKGESRTKMSMSAQLLLNCGMFHVSVPPRMKLVHS